LIGGAVHATPRKITASQDAKRISAALMRCAGFDTIALSVWPAGGLLSPVGIFLSVLFMATLYAVACAAIQARTVPTFQAVTRSDNLMGLGNVPFFTLRHSVGAENGKGAGLLGCLGLWTRCASRMYALSGRVSNDGIVGVVDCAGMLAAIGVLGLAGFSDISCRPMK